MFRQKKNNLKGAGIGVLIVSVMLSAITGLGVPGLPTLPRR